MGCVSDPRLVRQVLKSQQPKKPAAVCVINILAGQVKIRFTVEP